MEITSPRPGILGKISDRRWAVLSVKLGKRGKI